MLGEVNNYLSQYYYGETKMKDYVEIVNVKQAHLYIKNGLEPISVYWGRDRVVYRFDKELSKPLFRLWRLWKLS